MSRDSDNNQSEPSNSSTNAACTPTPIAHLGIDVSKAKLDVALLLDSKQRNKVVPNNPAGFAQLLAWLATLGVDVGELHACMEATGPYSDASATALADAGVKVSIVNPARIKGFGQSELVRNKTDEVDAALIARFCAAMKPQPCQPPSVSQRKPRAMADRLQALKDNAQQEQNRLEGADESVTANIDAHLSYLEQAIAALTKDIDRHIDDDPSLREDAKLLNTIAGVSNLTASKVLAYAGDVSRLDNAKAFAAFVGVAPRLKRSGSSVKGRTTMGKGGSKALRHALFMPALSALRCNVVLKPQALRLKAKGMKGKAVVGAAMHKLAHLIYGVLKHRQPYRADWATQKTAKTQEVPTEGAVLA